MSRLAREVWLWEEEGRVCALLKTNVSEEWVRERLCTIGLCDLVEACERRADATRMHEGTHVSLLFKEGTNRDQVRVALSRL